MRQNKGFDLAVAVKENKDLRKQIKELQTKVDELTAELKRRDYNPLDGMTLNQEMEDER